MTRTYTEAEIIDAVQARLKYAYNVVVSDLEAKAIADQAAAKINRVVNSSDSNLFVSHTTSDLIV